MHQCTCLKQNLLHGPGSLNNSVSVLKRFCQEKCAVMADIEKMFHQNFVTPPPNTVASDYKMLVHVFGKVDSPCCANWALKKLHEIVGRSLKRVVTNNFYVDVFYLMKKV